MFKKQLRSVIAWNNPDSDLLFSRWTENGDEIKNASKLIVEPGQGCVFVYEGKVQGIFTEEGMYDLATDNVPFLTTIKKVMQSFTSEHKVGIYYFRQGDFLNKRWGTKSVIKYDDPKYKFPVGLRAFGNYSIRISDAAAFFRNNAAGQTDYWIQDIQEVFLSRITEPMTTVLANAQFSYAQIDANRGIVASAVLQAVQPIFTDLGFDLTDFRIEGTNFDEDTERRIGKIADMNAEAQAASAAGLDYAQIQQLEAMKLAANNQGGAAGLGLNMAAGMQLGQMFGQNIAQQPAVAQPSAPQSGGGDDSMERLAKLKKMFDMELIDDAEYKDKKAAILAEM